MDNQSLTQNGTQDSQNLTLSDVLERYCSLALHLDRYITPIWYAIGITGNIVSAKIWLERRMRRNNSSAIYLAALSINDTIFLLLHILLELKYAWFKRTVDYPVVCEAYSVVYLVTNYLAPALVLGFTVERFIAVCYPYQKFRFCNANRAVKVVLGLVSACLLLGGIQPYFWGYNATKVDCAVRDEHMEFWANWSWGTELMIFLVVPVVMLVINIRVMLEIRRISGPSELQPVTHQQSSSRSGNQTSNNKHSSVADTRRDTLSSRRGTVSSTANPNRHHSSCAATTNAMLLSVSFYVIFTTLPATIVYVLASAFPEGDLQVKLEEMTNDPVWVRFFGYYLVRKIVDEVCLSHYVCNFFLFMITGKMFRESFVSLVRCRVRSAEHKSEQSTKYYTIHRTEDGLDQTVLITKL